jgi:hypothetical protein
MKKPKIFQKGKSSLNPIKLNKLFQTTINSEEFSIVERFGSINRFFIELNQIVGDRKIKIIGFSALQKMSRSQNHYVMFKYSDEGYRVEDIKVVEKFGSIHKVIEKFKKAIIGRRIEILGISALKKMNRSQNHYIFFRFIE